MGVNIHAQTRNSDYLKAVRELVDQLIFQIIF
jgi:hypothetical protein